MVRPLLSPRQYRDQKETWRRRPPHLHHRFSLLYPLSWQLALDYRAKSSLERPSLFFWPWSGQTFTVRWQQASLFVLFLFAILRWCRPNLRTQYSQTQPYEIKIVIESGDFWLSQDFAISVNAHYYSPNFLVTSAASRASLKWSRTQTDEPLIMQAEPVSYYCYLYLRQDCIYVHLLSPDKSDVSNLWDWLEHHGLDTGSLVLPSRLFAPRRIFCCLKRHFRWKA